MRKRSGPVNEASLDGAMLVTLESGDQWQAASRLTEGPHPASSARQSSRQHNWSGSRLPACRGTSVVPESAMSFAEIFCL